MTAPYGRDGREAPDDQDRHTDVGAYALGLLGGEDADRFEEHLAGCVRCGAELDSMLGLGAVLDEVADHPGITDRPAPGLLSRLLTDAARRGRRDRRRRLLIAAAAAAVLAGGAVAVPQVLEEDGPGTPAEAVRTAFRDGEKFSGTDPATGVEATVALASRRWGTQVTLRLGNLEGPRTCDLVAVGERGERQTVSSWSVPSYGYGIEGTRWEEPLYIGGAAALAAERIDRFEVRTLDGELLATVEL